MLPQLLALTSSLTLSLPLDPSTIAPDSANATDQTRDTDLTPIQLHATASHPKLCCDLLSHSQLHILEDSDSIPAGQAPTSFAVSPGCASLVERPWPTSSKTTITTPTQGRKSPATTVEVENQHPDLRSSPILRTDSSCLSTTFTPHRRGLTRSTRLSLRPSIGQEQRHRITCRQSLSPKSLRTSSNSCNRAALRARRPSPLNRADFPRRRHPYISPSLCPPRPPQVPLRVCPIVSTRPHHRISIWSTQAIPHQSRIQDTSQRAHIAPVRQRPPSSRREDLHHA